MATEIHIKDMTMCKYAILLKFLNKLMVNMGKEQITDAVNFKHIKREELLIEKNEEVYTEMKDEIHNYFGKYNLKYTQKKIIKHYILTVLKSMCAELFLNLESKVVRKRVGKTGMTYMVYYITADIKQ
jgi:hypothetical protein